MDPSISTISIKHHVIGVTVGLINEGLKSLEKKIECERFMNSFVNTSVFFFIFMYILTGLISVQ